MKIAIAAMVACMTLALAPQCQAKGKPTPGGAVEGIDLAGLRFDIKAKSKQGTTSVNNFTLWLINQGNQDASNSRVEFYLSDDAVLTTQTNVMDPLTTVDQLIHTQALGKVKAGRTKKRTVGGGLLKQLSATSGQYIFAVIDADDDLLEADEQNNILFDQLP